MDVQGFNQSKAILENAMEDINHYLKLFHKGEYKAFPQVKIEEWSVSCDVHLIQIKSKLSFELL